MAGSMRAVHNLDAWLAPFLDVLGRKTRRTWAPLYLRGLLGSGERKSLPLTSRPDPETWVRTVPKMLQRRAATARATKTIERSQVGARTKVMRWLS